MRAQIAIIALLGCIGVASAIPFFSNLFGNKVDNARRDLLSGEGNTPEKTLAKLQTLKKVAAEAKNTEDEDFLKYYLDMTDVSDEKCSFEAFQKIESAFDVHNYAEWNIRPYRHHWATEQFKRCHEQFKLKLKKAVESLTEENKEQLALFLDITKPYTENESPQELVGGVDWTEQIIGELIPKYMKVRDPAKFEADIKSKSAEELATEAIKIFHDATEDIYENAKSGTDFYFEVGYIDSIAALLDDYELEWLGKLRTTNDLGALAFEVGEVRKNNVIAAAKAEYEKIKSSL